MVVKYGEGKGVIPRNTGQNGEPRGTLESPRWNL